MRRSPPCSPRSVLTKASVAGITSGTLNSADAKCPPGYSVFGGSYLIGGNSVLAHTTVAANCARNATPIVVDGAFGNG